MTKIRYIKLENTGAFVARIHIQYKSKKTDAKGNVAYDADWSTWKNDGYCDVLACAERTVDLSKIASLSDGCIVRLKVFILLGNDRIASENFVMDSTSPNTAVYKISGTTLLSKLVYKGI